MSNSILSVGLELHNAKQVMWNWPEKGVTGLFGDWSPPFCSWPAPLCPWGCATRNPLTWCFGWSLNERSKGRAGISALLRWAFPRLSHCAAAKGFVQAGAAAQPVRPGPSLSGLRSWRPRLRIQCSSNDQRPEALDMKSFFPFPFLREWIARVAKNALSKAFMCSARANFRVLQRWT